jgi:hypothetical protein
MENETCKNLERASSPESLGIDSRVITEFLEYCEKEAVELHSFMLLRKGKVAAEAWRKPFTANTPHTMFSFSKSVVSTAIGFAIDEGLIALDTKVYTLFPEYVPVKKKKWAELLTVEQLLTMTGGKKSSLLLKTEKPGWVPIYLKTRFKYKPGKRFEYVTENSFMLSAIIRKVTGMSITNYLTPRLFEPLGIDVPLWEKNKSGDEVGGWGLHLKTEDQAKLALCYLSNGRYAGKQVIPEYWAKTAGEKHVPVTPGGSKDYSLGYGYQFWRCQIPNTYRFDGLFSQFGIIFQDFDACIVTSAGEPFEQKMLDAIWKFFPKCFGNDPLPENGEALAALRDKIENLSMPCLPPMRRREDVEAQIDGKLMKFKYTKTASVLGSASNTVRAVRSGSFNNVRLSFKEDFLAFTWTEKYNENTIQIGYGPAYITSEAELAGSKFSFASSCTWLDDGSLEVWIRPLQHAQYRRLNFTFNGKRVKMESAAEKGLFDMAIFDLDFKGRKTGGVMHAATRVAAVIAKPVLDPNLRGRIVEPMYR